MAGVSFNIKGVILGAKASWPIGISVFTYGLVFGVISRQAGLDLVGASTMSIFVFAGASQLIAMEMWGTHLAAWSIILTTLAVNLRHILMGAALRPWFAGLTRLQSYGSLFFMNDESWALTMERSSRGLDNRAFLLGSGLVVYFSWLSATIIGQCAVSGMEDPSKWGLDFAFTAVFLTLLMGFKKSRADLIAWAIAAVAAILSHMFIPGKWYILLGSMLGSASYAIMKGGRDG